MRRIMRGKAATTATATVTVKDCRQPSCIQRCASTGCEPAKGPLSASPADPRQVVVHNVVSLVSLISSLRRSPVQQAGLSCNKHVTGGIQRPGQCKLEAVYTMRVGSGPLGLSIAAHYDARVTSACCQALMTSPMSLRTCLVCYCMPRDASNTPPPSRLALNLRCHDERRAHVNPHWRM